MDDKQLTEQRLRELADALRPASDDLSQPELAELAEQMRHDPHWKAVCQRSGRLDLAVSDAMHDLPVPPGAVDRLLARLAAVAPPTADDDARAPSHPVAGPVPRPSPRFSKRMAGAGVLATAGAIALVAYLFGSPSVVLGPEDILQEVAVFAMKPSVDEEHPMAVGAPPSDYPASAALVGKTVAWRKIDGLLDRSGVAYALRSAGAQATLYVIDAHGSRRQPRLVDLPASPPPTPMSTTGGGAKSAWSEGHLVYLLVVDGGAQEYQAFVAQPRPLASSRSPRRVLSAVLPPQSSGAAFSAIFL